MEQFDGLATTQFCNERKNLMKAKLFAIICGFILLVMSGCTGSEPYRTITTPLNVNQSCEFTDGEGGKLECSLQHHIYNTGTSYGEHDYYLSFVEFDDQGWFNQIEQTGRKQMENLLNFLYAQKEEYLIFVYAHGWRHNASPCDENVACFRQTLERLALMERAGGDNRKVVGVYVGWRGLSVSTKPLGFLELTSFWERKNTANRVGHGEVTELLVRLNEFREFKQRQFRQDHKDGAKTHLIITGHSFGGQVIYSALSQLLLQHSSDTKGFENRQLTYGPARSFGDLVVLINPAFEGSKYEPLYDISRNRCFPESQRPVMLVVTSKEDGATKTAFRLGRWFSTFWERAQTENQAKTILNTVGHLKRYKTHDLCLKAGGACRDYDGFDEPEAKECQCRYLKNTPEVMNALLEEVEYYSDQYSSSKITSTDPIDPGKISTNLAQEISYGDEISLIPSDQYSERNPFLVISTDGHLIQGHNEIYGEEFTNFLRRFYLRHIYFPTLNSNEKDEKLTRCSAKSFVP